MLYSKFCIYDIPHIMKIIGPKNIDFTSGRAAGTAYPKASDTTYPTTSIFGKMLKCL